METSTKLELTMIALIATLFFSNCLYDRYQIHKHGKFFIPDGSRVEYEGNLKKVWNKVEDKHPSFAAKKDEVLKDYKTKTSCISKYGYQEQQQFGINNVISNLDYEKVAEIYGLDSNKLQYFMKISQSITPDLLTTIVKSELFKNPDPDDEQFNYVLGTAGPWYLNFFPAMHDTNLFSWGDYQFTKHALCEEDSLVGASKMHSCRVGDERIIPSTVEELYGMDHHEAATYLALHNIVTVVKKFTSEELDFIVEENRVSNYIINCHHHHSAITALERLVADSASQPFAQYYTSNLKEYAKKVAHNLKNSELF